MKKKIQILGRKIIHPTKAAPIAAIKTAPAAISLAFPANTLNSGETRSVNASIAVFIPSAHRTIAIDSITKLHSVIDIEKNIPAEITINTKTR